MDRDTNPEQSGTTIATTITPAEILAGTGLICAELAGADLRGMDLRGCDLENLGLSGVNLAGADLRDANLAGADLRGADLTGTRLEGAYFGGVACDYDTRWPEGFNPADSGAILISG